MRALDFMAVNVISAEVLVASAVFACHRQFQGLHQGLDGRIVDERFRISAFLFGALLNEPHGGVTMLADVVALLAGDHRRPEILVALDATELILEVISNSRARHVANVFVRLTNYTGFRLYGPRFCRPNLPIYAEKP